VAEGVNNDQYGIDLVIDFFGLAGKYGGSPVFDQTITLQHKELQAVTKAIHEAEKKLAGKSSPEAAALIKQARELAFTPVVDAALLRKPAFLDLFSKAVSKKGMGEFADKQLNTPEEQWNSKAKANYAKALDLAQQASAAIK
jgi:hypothetical protein